jgi:hypothetical protein
MVLKKRGSRMKLKAGADIIKEGWIRRKKGFRVRFEKRTDSGWVSDYIPDPTEKPWTSEVSTWELARRLAEATSAKTPGEDEDTMVNITVVDDLDNPVKFYAVGATLFLNPRSH